MFNIRDIAISIGFVILIPLALIYGLSAFMKRPTYPYFQEVYNVKKELHTLKKEVLKKKIEEIKDSLEKMKKKLELKQKEFERKASAEEIEHVERQLEKGNKESEERKLEYENDMSRYDFNYMVISLVSGIIAFLIGIMLVESLGAGVMFGGVVCIIYGLRSYWDGFDDITRFSILLGALLLLFAIGYVRFLQRRKRFIS